MRETGSGAERVATRYGRRAKGTLPGVPFMLLVGGLVLSLVSCSDRDLISPGAGVHVIVNARLGESPDRGPGTIEVAAGPAAITRVEVEVRVGVGPGAPFLASGGAAVVGGLAEVEIMVARRDSLVFDIRALDVGGTAQYRWVSPPRDLTGAGEAYELRGEGGGDIVLEPLLPGVSTLYYYEVSAFGPAFFWDRCDAPDFARYDVRGSEIPGITRTSPLLYSTSDREQLYISFPPASFPAQGTDFFLRLFVVDSEGLISGSPEIEVSVPPWLEGSFTGPYDFYLHWSASADQDFVRYEVYGSTNPDVPREPEYLVYQTPDRGETSGTVVSNNSDTSYYFRMFALDQGGVIGVSDTLELRTPPADVLRYDDGSFEDAFLLDQNWEGYELLQHFDPVPGSKFRLGGLVVSMSIGEGGWGVLRPIVRGPDGTILYTGDDMYMDHMDFYAVEFGREGLYIETDYYAGFQVVQSGVAPGPADRPQYWALDLDTSPPGGTTSCFYHRDSLPAWPPDTVPQKFAIRALVGTYLGAPSPARPVR